MQDRQWLETVPDYCPDRSTRLLMNCLLRFELFLVDDADQSMVEHCSNQRNLDQCLTQKIHRSYDPTKGIVVINSWLDDAYFVWKTVTMISIHIRLLLLLLRNIIDNNRRRRWANTVTCFYVVRLTYEWIRWCHARRWTWTCWRMNSSWFTSCWFACHSYFVIYTSVVILQKVWLLQSTLLSSLLFV